MRGLYAVKLVVRNWISYFNSKNCIIDSNSTMALICIPNFEMRYYDESVLITLARVIEKSIKLGVLTMEVLRGTFVRTCAELSLNNQALGRIKFDNFFIHNFFIQLNLLRN